MMAVLKSSSACAAGAAAAVPLAARAASVPTKCLRLSWPFSKRATRSEMIDSMTPSFGGPFSIGTNDSFQREWALRSASGAERSGRLSDNERVQHRHGAGHRTDRSRASDVVLINGKLVTGAGLGRNELERFLSLTIQRHRIGSGLLAEFIETEGDDFLRTLEMSPSLGDFRAASTCG